MEHGMGCRKPQKDIRDFKVCATPNAKFVENFELKMPRVKNQNQVNSCCAHAASTILEWYANNQEKLSTEFIYGIERSFCGDDAPGMYMVDACKIAANLGDMLEVDCPGNHEVPYASIAAEEAAQNSEKMETAKKFVIDSYYRASTADDIKFAISNYGPVLACIFWESAYNVDKNGVVHFGTGKEITNEGGVPTNGGYHAVVIYGWNKEGWLVQNSWGTSFANGGRFILPYEYEIPDARVFVEARCPRTTGLVRKNTEKNLFVRIINKFLKKS